MLSWKDVKGIVEVEVIALMKDPVIGSQWLTDLETSLDGQRLGVCIAIDVAAGAVDGKMFAQVLDSIDSTYTDPRGEFGRIVNTLKPFDFICTSKFFDTSSDTLYVRVLELGDFIEFYVDRGYTRAPGHVKRIRDMYFDLPDGVELSGIRTWFRGRVPNAWVMPFDDLVSLITAAPRGYRASAVYDALGFSLKGGVGGKGRSELVGVRYPSGFGVGCSQPTTLDAWWLDAGALYLSYGDEDAWGRTHCISGTHSHQRERVHSLFKNLTAGYRTYYIGVVKHPPKLPSPDSLLEEGYRRLEKVLAARTP